MKQTLYMKILFDNGVQKEYKETIGGEFTQEIQAEFMKHIFENKYYNFSNVCFDTRKVVAIEFRTTD